MARSFRETVKSVPGAEDDYRRVQAKRERARGVDVDALNQQMQLVLLNQYRQQFRDGAIPYPRIRDAGFRCYSQFEEDGILLYILASIGMTTRRVVEIGCGSGSESMSANLILTHGFDAWLVDGSVANAAAATRFYAGKRQHRVTSPVIRQAWITRDNVNDVLQQAGAAGEVDVLSLDIDGNDWHVWKALEVVRPRVCVVETHDIIPSDLSLTIPYRDDFDAWSRPEPEREFRGASLLAMTRLAESKGYRLIGGHRHGFNAFFLREELGQDHFPTVSVESVHDNAWTRYGQAVRWPKVRGMGWLEV